ncbi:MAG TPA: NRDE family protein [Candidatus Kryptonia bacterium]|nr:NRDE family protein [Candidatus Kryptonia bacterium]
MCTLALYRQRFAPYPLVVAANRDELYDRPANAPQLIADEPWVVAGQDLVAGGTWLGVNQAGLVVGLLNRRRAAGLAVVDPTLRSRGLLALEMLHCRSADEALARLRSEDGGRYNGFNLLIATPHEAYVAHNADHRVAITVLPPGVHLLTNLELNDPTCPRIAKSARLFESVALTDDDHAEALVARLRTILSDHSTPLDPRSPLPSNNLCVHTERFGTCSSTIIAFSAERQRYRLWHAPGPPCDTPFREVPLPN